MGKISRDAMRTADGDQKRLRGSIEHTSAQQLKARPSEHHSLERF
jgi:hypothetical protein